MPILRRSVVQFCSAPLVRFHTALDKRVLRTIGSEISGEIVGHRIEFYITCQDCLVESPPQVPKQRLR